MKHISILIPEGDCSLTHIEATYQIMSEVNVFLEKKEEPRLFTIQLVGLRKDAMLKKGMFSIHPDVLIRDVAKTDLVIIPALQGKDLAKSLELNQEFVPWMIRQYNNGAALASLCIGSFLLASTGLLNGKKCTTHWSAAPVFRSLYPEVNLMPDKIITDEANILTSGGALSFTSLIVYLIEKYAGRAMAIEAAKTFMIDLDRDSQSPFIIFKGQKDHSDAAIKQAQDFIEQHYSERLTIDDLASRFAIGRRNLERRFKKATANTVAEYIQRVKIEAAKMSLEASSSNVNEVMYQVGYTDPKAFRMAFKKVTGLSPVQYRGKYSRQGHYQEALQ